MFIRFNEYPKIMKPTFLTNFCMHGVNLKKKNNEIYTRDILKDTLNLNPRSTSVTLFLSMILYYI